METLGKESPSYSTVKKWTAELTRDGGGECIEDDERSGRPKEATTDKMLRLCTVWSCVTGGETCEI